MEWIDEIKKLVSSDIWYSASEDLLEYASDYTEDLSHPPHLVAKPETVEEIATILKFCTEKNIPVTPRGAGTGLSGGSLPIQGGISLSLEKFNRILEIDEENLQATVEAGVINETFQQAVREKGLFYPPDPASKGSCQLGGNIAHASGGPKALKYGTTRDYVLNLQVVLPTGEIIWTGADTLKYSTGYNLTHLIVGSEGTLGVVTKIVFKLIPLPLHDITLLAQFDSLEYACNSVPQVFTKGITPCAMELMERNAIEFVAQHGLEHQKIAGQNLLVNPNTQAYLLIEVDGNDLNKMMDDCASINEVLELNNCTDVQFADSSDQKERLWSVRRSIGEIVKLHSIYKEEDTVVKRASLPKLITEVKRLGNEYNFQSVCYGHAGDGNLHINILKGNMTDQEWNGPHLEEAIRKIFRLCKTMGGTISGEHGIGLVQKKYMNEVLDPIHIHLMRCIKQVFDPSGIMNPGKIWE